MSSRARRLAPSAAQPFDWGGARPAPLAPGALVAEPAPPAPAVDAAQIERDAFMKGYAQGERAGAEAAAARAEAILRRLADTIDELRALKADILARSEQQVVQLALAIARRVIHREVSLDPALLEAMGRVALERLGAGTSATIRLHPDDYAAVTGGRPVPPADPGGSTVVPDPMVRRGGCLVQSDFGLIDVSVDAQIDELTATLLGDAAPAPPAPAHAVVPR